ncbi:hypothetical protein EGK70_007390 [Alcaligenes aquatilis]|uniref:hypothetical protein n=1 Tax=Alcaligenes aquatilis TaxID=323284 RepID=UPI000F665B9F|nr:hypothetical protein [Alcaligenes aquatilis]QXR37304.1 hypothetical protein EGK70_007390 [Alcaligenes aquatilis]
MTTYKTGNPLGSADPKDLYDNAENLDAALNSQSNTWADRLGNIRPTYRSAIDPTGLVQDAVDAAVRAEVAADAAAMAGRVFDTSAQGIANTTNGQYFSVPASDAQDSLILYQNVNGNAVERKRYPSSLFDSLTANRGKAFPLKAATRSGVVSEPRSASLTAFLKISVSGPADEILGRYFKIAYMQNGAILNGVAANGIRIEEFDASTYATDGTATIIHATSDTPAEYDRIAGGIQTFVVTPALRPNIRISVTIDADGLTPYGEQLQMGAEGENGWSWIIDPSCYLPIKAEPLGELRQNKGTMFPMRIVNRGGIVSLADPTIDNAVLFASVSGPASEVEGKYFRIAYLQNGASLTHGATTGIRIEQSDPASFSTTGAVLVIHASSDSPAGYDRSAGGIQTVVITPSQRPNIRITLTLDVDALPPWGTHIQMGNTTSRYYSGIIDPSCYIPVSSTSSNFAPWAKPTFVSFSAATGHLDTAAATGSGKMTQFRFRPNGFNNLPNPHGLGVADYGDPTIANFVSYNSNTSEWFGVMHIRAVDGDGGRRIATGGNHGSDGGAGGERTARNISYEIYVDGIRLTSDFSGYAEKVEIVIVNELMAYNTVTLGRYVLRQSFSVMIRGNAVSVDAEYVAKEPIYIQRDSGLQLVSAGYMDTVIFPGGINTQRNPFDTFTSESGPSSDAPDAWAVVMKGPQGQIAMWMDRTFGLAALTEHVAPNRALVRAAKSSSTKVYNSLIYGADLSEAPDDTALFMQTGDSYRWRGGYTWSVPSAYQAGIDSEICRIINGIARHAIVFSDASYSRFDA